MSSVKTPAQSGAHSAPQPGTWLVVGLGNPGEQYARTRHNLGRLVLDELAERHNAARFSTHKRSNTDIADVSLPPQKIILARPRSMMNLSGGPVKNLADFFSVPLTRIVVIYDDLELDPGVVQVREGGGDRGHNGLKSISKSLGSKDYWRIACGIGRPPGRMDPAAYVLKPFPRSEDAEVAILCADAADEIDRLIAR